MARRKRESNNQSNNGPDSSGNSGPEPRQLSPELYFHAIDGSELKSILELADALDMMSDDTFYYHVTHDRNDFASWIAGVFAESELADSIRKCNGRIETQICVLKHLVKSK
ncbi:hypothetical protein J4212_00635 [Candidatus Woesearchaeota archaeon]|nr:hypothetical protein [Candidatus Woesearchaeota archaeon]